MNGSRDYLWLTAPAPSKSEQIIAQVAGKHGVPVRDLKGPCRERELIPARFEAYARLRRETGMSLPQIARAMNRVCHKTIQSGIRKHERRAGRE